MRLWLINDFLAGSSTLAFAAADAVAKATILLGLAAVVAAVLHRSSAAVRHRLWGLTLCGMIAIPLLSWSLPGWRIPILMPTTRFFDSWVSRNEGGAKLSISDLVGREVLDDSRADRHGAGPGSVQIHQPGRLDGRSNPAFQPSRLRSFLVNLGAGRSGSSWMMLLWGLGFFTTTLPVLAGAIGNERRRRRSGRVDDPNWLRLRDEIAREVALRRCVELRMGPAPLIPATCGILRPVVLLPDTAEHWSEPVRRLVLLHELSHVKRWDVEFQLIGRFAAAAYWFHPMAWYALHRLRLECECACDDYVVHVGAVRTRYAQQLVNLARTLRSETLTAAVPMTRKTALEERIRALFDDRRSHQPLGHHGARTLLCGAFIFMMGLAAVHLAPIVDAQPPPAVAALAPTPEDPPMPSPNGAVHKMYHFAITIQGRAVDRSGKPIPGAHVYLASRLAEFRRVAEAVTGAEGQYEFHEVPLPIEHANTVNGHDMGRFQVFGEAEGMGFAWRPVKSFFPVPEPPPLRNALDMRDPPESYAPMDKIVLDLRFSPAAHFSGTVLDDRGNPIPGVRLEIRDCESLEVVDNIRPGWTLDALNEPDTVPPTIKVRNTDAAGRFNFTGLPADCRFRIDVRAKGFPSHWVYAATTRGPQPNKDGSPVLTGDFTVTLATPLDVPIQMVYADTGEPAPRVAVQAGGSLETTDDQGRATLRLAPGTYRMENWPARGTSYLVTEGKLVVEESPPVKPVVASLRRAGVVEITVVYADTGAGIPDIDVWEQTDPNGQREPLVSRSWEAATRIVWRDRPRTDARGKIRALVEPGKHRIGVGLESYPRGYEVVESGGQEVECRSGETVRLIFTLRKRP